MTMDSDVNSKFQEQVVLVDKKSFLQRVGIADRVCPSVRPSSVTFRCFVETNEATIMQFSPTGSAIILVSGEVKIVWKFAGDHL